MPSASVIRQFVSFTAIGTAAFVLDAGILMLMIRVAHLDPYAGRVVSFLCAASFTWILNRTYTFGRDPRRRRSREWAHYVGVNAVGAAVNFGVYAWLIATAPYAADHPVAAVAAGSLAGLLFNFTLSRLYVFRTTS